MTIPLARARGPRRRRRARQPAVRSGVDFLDRVARARRSAASTERRSVVVRAGLRRSTVVAVLARADRHRHRPMRSTAAGCDAASDDPLDERLGAGRAACSATPTTSTTASRELVGGPGRALRELARPRSFDAAIIDGAVNGVGGLVDAAPRCGCGSVQNGLVRRYALGIVLGAVAPAPLRRHAGRAR